MFVPCQLCFVSLGSLWKQVTRKKKKNPFSSFLYFVICYWFEFSVFPSNHQHILCRAPNPPPRQTKGVRDCIGTLYFLFQTLVGPSLIIESKYHIKRIQNKTTTVVVFTVSIHIVMSLIYIYIYIYLYIYIYIYIQKLYIYIYIFRARNLHVVNPYKCVGLAVCGKSRTSSSVSTRIKNPC